jgi:hypothetical protein
VPQIWLTYDELGALVGCDAIAARSSAAAMQLDRRKSHDGNTRAKLNVNLSEIFFDRLVRQWVERETGICAADLHAIHQRMAVRPAAAERAPAAIAG